MGWANDSFARELANAGIFPANHRSSSRSSSSPSSLPSSSYNEDKVKETAKLICDTMTPKRQTKYQIIRHYEYFPTDPQVRTLNLITSVTGVIFEGKTKLEARAFIKQYLNVASEMLKEAEE